MSRSRGGNGRAKKAGLLSVPWVIGRVVITVSPASHHSKGSMTMGTHTFQVTVRSDRLEDFAENLAVMGVKVDADELMRARMEGEVDLMVDKHGDYATAWVARFPRSWLKLPGVYVKDFFYSEEADDGDKLQDPEEPFYDQKPGDARFVCVSPTPVHSFQWYSWEGPFAEGPFFHLPLKIKFVQETEDASHCRYWRTKLTWDKSYRWFVIKLP